MPDPFIFLVGLFVSGLLGFGTYLSVSELRRRGEEAVEREGGRLLDEETARSILRG